MKRDINPEYDKYGREGDVDYITDHNTYYKHEEDIVTDHNPYYEGNYRSIPSNQQGPQRAKVRV